MNLLQRQVQKSTNVRITRHCETTSSPPTSRQGCLLACQPQSLSVGAL